MSNILEGEIKNVYKNYGVLTSNVKGEKVELYFLILPEMFDDGKFNLTKRVTFKTRKIEVRKSDVLIAYSLKSVKDKENSDEINVVKDNGVISANSYYEYLFKNMLNEKEIDSSSLKDLISLDKKAKEFFFKWILFIESIIKHRLTILTKDLDSSDIYEKLSEYKNTNSVVTSRFKNIRTEYMFKPEFNLLELKQHGSDPNDNKVVDCPFFLFLEALTLTELGEVLSVLIEEEILYKECSDYKCLYYLKDTFLELSFIRNKSAHGNPLVPHILDNNFNPSYVYEMVSAFPDWNIKDNVEKWSLFNFIRFTVRMLAKQGIQLIRTGSPMLSALYFTKSLLINPAKRSFFMFFYVMMVINAYADGNDANEGQFWNDSMILINNISDCQQINNIFDVFPSEDSSIKKQLSLIIFPLVTYKLQGNDYFRMTLESTFDIGRTQSK
ncbi:Abi family protein [Enterococcus faecium]|uniref:Abi family protein n=1 Tax=Enterococcus faecium TaxID=1352 RepID=UPI00289097CE|nr:Abi family protein [Enterococcus faecium]EMF0445297.1 Abi family protein [Enterococcus faecium]MDT2316648.1 Abi family protein [Enterococcus faecium]